MTPNSADVDCISRQKINENCAYKTNKSRRAIILKQIFKIGRHRPLRQLSNLRNSIIRHFPQEKGALHDSCFPTHECLQEKGHYIHPFLLTNAAP